tara:strand:+ start:330 stop:536 length:207 start_codon:yes stop_codon:yes gene_type:complete
MNNDDIISGDAMRDEKAISPTGHMISTGNLSKYGQPLFLCEECKKEHTVTYALLNSELCWDCYQEYHC